MLQHWIIFHNKKKHYAGGNSLNKSIRFKELGFNSSFIGAIGTDNAGDRIEELLKKNNVDISHMYRKEGITANNQIINDENGERFGVENAWQDGVYKGMNIIDIAYFGGTKSQLDDLVKISKDFKGIIVLTLGSDGSIAIKDQKTYYQKSLPLEKVIDTTGCGDAFQSGFTSNYFITKDINKALLCGAEMGQKAAMNYGGVNW